VAEAMRVVAIIQARMKSTRLPGKALSDIEGRPLLEILLSRLSLSTEIDEIAVATSCDESDDPIALLAESLGYFAYRGSVSDVRSRYTQAANLLKADCIVRITGDCPLVDHTVVDQAIERFRKGDVDYVSNVNPPTFPDGLDVEVFSLASLEEACNISTGSSDLEHVTPVLRSEHFTSANIELNPSASHVRLTVDVPEDLSVVRNIFSHFSPTFNFGYKEVLALRNEAPELFEENKLQSRNEGYNQGTGQKLWQRAKRVIPGGNMLLSKRSELFLPDMWPSYFSRAKGCRVWDLDGNEFIDMATMGVGTNILGYQNKAVDSAVIDAVNSGTMSTLNAPEEVYLAEKLVSMNPWADMVKLARTGGEANAIAIRIARAASGKDKVAICGYHGWHDWYLSANLGDDQSLDGHLLPGLEPKGVPRALAGTVETFLYNDYMALESIVSKGDVGVIKMEVVRNDEPENDFLLKVRDLATRQGIVLIFDECTSGFRETFGGLHESYGVEPDIAVYGKALGNGYPITAVVGRREVMQAAQATFISSTFWSDRVGPVAALAALAEMERIESWKTITATGMTVQKFVIEKGKELGLPITTSGRPAILNYKLNSELARHFKTFITKEMLSRGYLASTSFYSSIAHTDNEISSFLQNLGEVFELAAQLETALDYSNSLGGVLCHEGFSRLN
jgi:glutamate-1-semialdehyde 2,1-aminomutase